MKREALSNSETGTAAASAGDAPSDGARGASASADLAPATVHAPTGTHVLADLSGIAAEKLSDCAQLEALLRAAAEAAHARVLFSHFHGFGEGQGVTGVVLLAESHITIHTWPECGFAAADIFMCGSAEPKLALTLIESALQPEASHIHTARRGPPR